MQAYEFHTTAQNGFIKIPDEYAKRITSNIRVIVLPSEKVKKDKRSLFPNFSLDTTGYKFDREEANER